MDPLLHGIARSAEQGQYAPALTVMAGGVVISGTPTTGAEIEKAVQRTIKNAIYYSLSPTQETRDEVFGIATGEANEIFAVDGGEGSGGAPILVLKEATVRSGSSQNGISVPWVRVQVDRIDAWFPGAVQSSESGGQGFVGAIVPLPDL